MNIDQVMLDEILELEQVAPNTFLGIAPNYPWGRLYGGQVVAQSLRAAQLTVESKYRVHSLHGYFVRGGSGDELIRLEVERLRDGSSFVTRRIVAHQFGKLIFIMSASFQVSEAEADVGLVSFPEDVGSPEDFEDDGWGRLRRRQVRLVGGRYLVWVRVDELGFVRSETGTSSTVASSAAADRLAIGHCGLGFLSDALAVAPVVSSHPLFEDPEQARERFMVASLDHSIFFHRSADIRQWILADVECRGLSGGRGVVAGELFTADRTHVATFTQEVLIRVSKRRSSNRC